ncbi:MAG: HepT-like ribonuclease domain-containing protein [Mycobacteriales bacterium]
MSRSDAERLEDIRSAISRCLTYRDHLESAELGSMAYDAVLRNLAVVGEAVKSLPDDFKQQHADVPWASIAGLRNVVVHEYFRVNPDMIRDIVDNQLAPLLDDLN